MDFPSFSSGGGCHGSFHMYYDSYVSDSISKSEFVPDLAETRRVESVRTDAGAVGRIPLSALVKPFLLVGAVDPVCLDGSTMKEDIISSDPPGMKFLLDSKTTIAPTIVPGATATVKRWLSEHKSDDIDDWNNVMLYALIPRCYELYQRRKRLRKDGGKGSSS